MITAGADHISNYFPFQIPSISMYTIYCSAGSQWIIIHMKQLFFACFKTIAEQDLAKIVISGKYILNPDPDQEMTNFVPHQPELFL